MSAHADQVRADTLLVIGVHRAELAFGRAVAERLPVSGMDVLAISDGLSGHHPLPDEVYRYERVHQALYGQLLSFIRPSHRLVIDLHTGTDSVGPCADIFTASTHLRKRIALEPVPVRCWALGSGLHAGARTVVPASIWNNPHFTYVALEIYLPPDGTGWEEAVDLAIFLVERLRALPEQT